MQEWWGVCSRVGAPSVERGDKQVPSLEVLQPQALLSAQCRGQPSGQPVSDVAGVVVLVLHDVAGAVVLVLQVLHACCGWLLSYFEPQLLI